MDRKVGTNILTKRRRRRSLTVSTITQRIRRRTYSLSNFVTETVEQNKSKRLGELRGSTYVLYQ